MKVIKLSEFETVDNIEEISAIALIVYILNQPWHKLCEIIPKYIPPNPSKDTQPIVAIRFNNGKEHMPYLRYNKGPKQGYFWDLYGEDFISIELAIYALSQAPTPVDVSPITFTLDTPNKEEGTDAA